MVACAALVEHGCEKTHNDFMASTLEDLGEDKSKWGYASIQLDGGIEAAYAKIRAHFQAYLDVERSIERQPAPMVNLRVAIVSVLRVPSSEAATMESPSLRLSMRARAPLERVTTAEEGKQGSSASSPGFAGG